MKDHKQEGGDHYRNLDVQPWEALESWMTKEQFHGFLLGSAVTYLARFNVKVAGKGGVTDIKKARHYLEALEQCLTKTK